MICITQTTAQNNRAARRPPSPPLLLPLLALLMLLSPLAVCPAQTEAAAAAAASSAAELAAAESLAFVSKECDHKLTQIESLAKFELFMSHFAQTAAHFGKPKRGLLNSAGRLRRCFDQVGPLAELRGILGERNAGVCRMAFVQRLLDFHAKYLLRLEQPPSLEHAQHVQANKTTFAGHIFALLAHQVAFTCKQRLSARLNGALLERQDAAGTQQDDDDDDCLPVIAPFLPQQTATGQPEREQDEDADSIQSFLSHFKRVEDLALLVRPAREAASSEPYFDIIVAPATLAKIDELKQLCRARHPHYMALFAPIAALAQLGVEVPDSSLPGASAPPTPQAERKLRCWLATAQLCQGILRTHISAKEPAEAEGAVAEENEADEEVEEGAKKLVEIKFGPVPSDVQLEEERLEAAEAQEALGAPDTFDELAPVVVELVRRRASLMGRVKGKLVAWAKRFVASHIDVDAVRDEGARRFMETLTRDQPNELEAGQAPVAFNGKRRNYGLFLPGRLVTDEADTLVQGSSFFVNKAIAIILSSVVAVCLSAVFVWFTLYALLTTLKPNRLPDASGNFKASWRELRDQRMKTIDDKVRQKGWKAKMMVYRSPTG